MAFKKEICRNHYLSDTFIENIFIDEYMPDAPGEYVKVYLYAYMYSGINQAMTNELVAKRLNMNIEDVLVAWTYWENVGIIKKYYPDPEDATHYDVEFINIKNAVYLSGSDAVSEAKTSPDIKSSLNDEAIASLYKEVESITGKMFDPANALKIAGLVDEGADPSIISFAYRYCKDNNKTTDFKFVAAIVRKWLQNNKNTVKDVKEFMEDTDNRFAEHRQIMKALGLNYNGITDEERKTFNRWLDEMNYSLTFILEACGKAAGMHNKYSYVKKVLKSEYEKKSNGSKPGFRKNTLNDRQKYYEQTRMENQLRTRERRTEIYDKIPRISKLEGEIRTLGMEIGRMMLSGKENRQEAVSIIKRNIREKQDEKKELLMKAGFSPEYMEDIYTCLKCKDTGILDDGGHCSCFKISVE